MARRNVHEIATRHGRILVYKLTKCRGWFYAYPPFNIADRAVGDDGFERAVERARFGVYALVQGEAFALREAAFG